MINMNATVRDVLAQHAKLSVDVAMLSDLDDLFGAGLTSLSTVTVMLALEDTFETEFPELMLSRRTFTSIESICEALTELSVMA